MSKVIYEEVYGVWGYKDKNGNAVDNDIGVSGIPMCPKCKEPTYSEDKCPFCRRKIRILRSK